MFSEKLKPVLMMYKDHEKLLKIGAIAAITVVALLIFLLKGENDTIEVDKALAAENQNATATEVKEDENNSNSTVTTGTIYVDISGQVKNPGVYKLSAGARVYEAIEEAGGLTKDADTSSINQAEEAVDGQKITIPSKEEVANGTVSPSKNEEGEGSATSSLVNINTADSKALETIPGVGPSTAEKIINFRENNGSFKKKEDIKNVSGIGDKTYEKMKDLITV